MKYLDFEKHIKNELGNAKEPVQMDALLTSLNLGKKQPSRKGFALWLLLPFLLLSISIFAWKYMDHKSNADAMFLSQAAAEKNNNQTLANNNNNYNEKSSITALDTEQNLDESNNVIKANQDEFSKNNNALNQDVFSKNNNEAQLNTTTPTKNNVNPTNKSLSDIQLNENYIKTVAISDDETQNSNSNTSSSKSQNSVTGDNIKSSFSSGAMFSPEPVSSNSKNLLVVEDLTGVIDGLDASDIDGKLFKRMKINCPSFDNSRWHLALIPEVGVFRPFKTLEYNATEASAAFNERINSEKTLEGLEIALLGMLVRDNVPLYLKAGVSYSRISERMELKYEYTEMDTTIGIISSTVSANGDTITHIYGDIITETTFKGSNRQHHYIHIFDVPISVGYTTYIAGLDVGIEAGIRVNFMTRATGNLLVTGNEYSNLSLNKMFKNRVGISYAGGLMIGRNFGRLGDIYIAPRFTYYPNSFNNQNNNINQNYFNIGLNAGIVYKIN